MDSRHWFRGPSDGETWHTTAAELSEDGQESRGHRHHRHVHLHVVQVDEILGLVAVRGIDLAVEPNRKEKGVKRWPDTPLGSFVEDFQRLGSLRPG